MFIAVHKFTEDGKIIYPKLAVSLEVMKRTYDFLTLKKGDYIVCGWCGQPCEPDGTVLVPELIPEGTDEDWNEAVPVHGDCCQTGDELYRSMNQEPSDDMLRDAGLL